MYLLFREKNWKPSDYYFLPQGEKKIVRVFLQEEMRSREKELKEIEGGAEG